MDQATTHWVIGTIASLGLTGGMAALGWAFWIQRSMMTRDEHQLICTQNQSTVLGRLDKLAETMEQRETNATQQREKVAVALDNIRTDVAVLKDRDDREYEPRKHAARRRRA